jgi:hypothetical protein
MATPTLIVIDVQRALDDPSYGGRSNPDAETMQRTALASLDEEFAEVLQTDEALARALGS